MISILILLPLCRAMKLLALSKGGLKDLSISRTSFSWGILSLLTQSSYVCVAKASPIILQP